jgi:outer membrane lipoprotein-sorting protein
MNGNRRFSYPLIGAALAAVALSGLPAHAQGGGQSTVTKTTPSTMPAPAAQPAPPPMPTQAVQPAPAAQPPAAQAPAAQPPAPEPNQVQAAAPQPNPLGAGWSPKFGTASPDSGHFTGSPEQMAVIQKIDAYFNDMKNLEGSFLQTDADEKRKKGKFFIERPGKLRFDYSLPSKQKIISDGKYLAIEDHDLNTTDRYPLDSTPFRLLLSKDVNLLRDARILALDQGQDIVIITVEDKQSDTGGQIRLFFDWPELKLKEWIISDPQGLNTRIQVADVELNKAVDPKVFKFSPDVGMPKFTP